jgi:hypothetical protein
MWIGRIPMETDMLFNVPEKYVKDFLENKKEGSAYKIVNGVVKGRSQACWFTIDHKKRHEEIRLYKNIRRSNILIMTISMNSLFGMRNDAANSFASFSSCE